MPTLTYLQAISAALRDELRDDERVLIMGEDIGVFGGAFKVTDGFIAEFGPDRVIDSPLAERMPLSLLSVSRARAALLSPTPERARPSSALARTLSGWMATTRCAERRG